MSKRPAPTRAELVMMALEGLYPCQDCGKPTRETIYEEVYLCDRCYEEWLAGELRDDDDE